MALYLSRVCWVWALFLLGACATTLRSHSRKEGAKAPGAPQVRSVDATNAVTTGWVNADACPDPANNWSYLLSQQRVLDELHGLSPSSEAVARLGEPVLVVRMYPSFQGERVLSLHRSAAGEYMLRSARLIEAASSQLEAARGRGRGSGDSLSEDRMEATLENLRIKKHVSERGLDERTATALLELWRALLSRAQTVREVGAATGKGDGVIYSISLADSGAVTHSPRPGSVLAEAVGSAELLFARVDEPSDQDERRLRVAQSQMQLALSRTRREESCLRPHVEAGRGDHGQRAP